MKKLIAILLVLCLEVSLCACGDASVDPDKQQTAKPTDAGESGVTTEVTTEATTEPPHLGINPEVYAKIKKYIIEKGTLSDDQSFYEYTHETNKYPGSLDICYWKNDEKITVCGVYRQYLSTLYATTLSFKEGDTDVSFVTQYATTGADLQGMRLIKGSGTIDLPSVTSLTQVSYDIITDSTEETIPSGYKVIFNNHIHGTLSATEEFLTIYALGSLRELGFSVYTPSDQLGELDLVLDDGKPTTEMTEIIVGEIVSVPDQYDFVVENVQFTTKISEQHGNIKYSISVRDEQKTYLAIKLKIINYTTDPISSFAINTSREPNHGLGTKVAMKYDGKYNYEGSYTILSHDDIQPLTSGIVYAYFEVPLMIESSTASVVVTLDIMGTLYTLQVR